jgi:hypothetical protein
MKKIFLFIAISCMFLTSCDETESDIYDGSQTLVYFETTAGVVQAIENGEGTITLRVGASTLSGSDRTVSLAANEESTALPADYILPASAIIPANEYFGEFTVTAVDTNLTDVAVTLIVDIISISRGGVASPTSLSLSLSEIVPFTGSYLLEQTSALIDGPTLSDGTTVLVTGNGMERSFDTANYPNYCATPGPFNFLLLTNGEIEKPIQDGLCTCGDGTDWFGPAGGANETYDINDDTEFLLTFADDRLENCGPVADTTYKLTKQ